MGKLATPLIILVLILSIAALSLGIMLFGQREILKGRTQKLELAAADFANGVRYEQLDPEALKDYERMDEPLKKLAVHADNQYVELQDTKQDLENTKVELAQAKDDLAQTKTELADAQSEIVDLKSELETKEVELAQASTRIDQLEQDKVSMQTQLDDLNDTLVRAEEETKDLQDQVATLEQTIEIMMAERGEIQPVDIPEGLSGHVVLVNPYWNFVVLDIGSEAGLRSTAELLVHRDDRLIGKIKVSTVEDEMAIAEIMMDWEQVPIREGDTVFYTREKGS